MRAETSSPAAPQATDEALRPGDRGDQVELLQFRLDRQGHCGPEGERLPQNGHYGPETEFAVRRFQEAHDLPATGVADQGTQSAVARAPYLQRAPVDSVEPVAAPSPAPTQEAFEHTVPPLAHEVAATMREARPVESPSRPSAAPPPLAAGGRSPERADEREAGQDTREHQPVPHAASPDPAATMATAAHRAAMDREEERPERKREDRDAAQVGPETRAATGMTAPAHPAHGMYLQAHSALEKIEAAPGLGGLTQHERQTLGAAAVSQALSASGWKISSVDHVVPSERINPQTGRPEAIFVVQGALDSPAHQRVAVNVEQALSQSIEQSSAVSQTVLQSRQQALEQEQARMQMLDQDGPLGPTMRIGGRTMSAPSSGDGGGGGGAGGGSGGGGGGGGGGG